VLVAVVAVGPSAWRFIEIDACLDRAGAWNYDHAVCTGG
jgi:hypothetical protein